MCFGILFFRNQRLTENQILINKFRTKKMLQYFFLPFVIELSAEISTSLTEIKYT